MNALAPSARPANKRPGQTRRRRRLMVWIMSALAVALIAGGLAAVFRKPPMQGAHEDTEEGFVLNGLRARIYNAGRLQGDVRAKRAVLLTEELETDLEDVRVAFYAPDGKLTGEVFSKRGKMYLKARPEQGIGKNDLQLTGDVRVESADGIRITTPRLDYNSREETLRSSGGWFEKRLPAGKNSQLVLRGIYFVAKNNMQDIIDYGAELRQETVE